MPGKNLFDIAPAKENPHGNNGVSATLPFGNVPHMHARFTSRIENGAAARHSGQPPLPSHSAGSTGDTGPARLRCTGKTGVL